MDEKIVNSAMKIILNAGDARTHNCAALDAIATRDFASAEKEMKEASKCIVKAHQFQTETIQGEARGEKTEYSMLFTHAQDTLMTINSEIVMTEKIIKIVGEIYESMGK